MDEINAACAECGFTTANASEFDAHIRRHEDGGGNSNNNNNNNNTNNDDDDDDDDCNGDAGCVSVKASAVAGDGPKSVRRHTTKDVLKRVAKHKTNNHSSRIRITVTADEDDQHQIGRNNDNDSNSAAENSETGGMDSTAFMNLNGVGLHGNNGFSSAATTTTTAAGDSLMLRNTVPYVLSQIANIFNAANVTNDNGGPHSFEATKLDDSPLPASETSSQTVPLNLSANSDFPASEAAIPESAEKKPLQQSRIKTKAGGERVKGEKALKKCPHCNFVTCMTQHMKSHLEAHERHRGQMYQCDICKTEFSQKANMHRHRTRHSGVKPYKCRYCKKEFFRKDQMQEHSMTHIKQGSDFDCPVARCERRFVQHPALRQHLHDEHTISADRQASCKSCSLLFSNPRRLMLHYQTKHEQDFEKTDDEGFIIPPSTSGDATVDSARDGASPASTVTTFGGFAAADDGSSPLLFDKFENVDDSTTTNGDGRLTPLSSSGAGSALATPVGRKRRVTTTPAGGGKSKRGTGGALASDGGAYRVEDLLKTSAGAGYIGVDMTAQSILLSATTSADTIKTVEPSAFSAPSLFATATGGEKNRMTLNGGLNTLLAAPGLLNLLSLAVADRSSASSNVVDVTTQAATKQLSDGCGTELTTSYLPRSKSPNYQNLFINGYADGGGQQSRQLSAASTLSGNDLLMKFAVQAAASAAAVAAATTSSSSGSAYINSSTVSCSSSSSSSTASSAQHAERYCGGGLAAPAPMQFWTNVANSATTSPIGGAAKKGTQEEEGEEETRKCGKSDVSMMLNDEEENEPSLDGEEEMEGGEESDMRFEKENDVGMDLSSTARKRRRVNGERRLRHGDDAVAAADTTMLSAANTVSTIGGSTTSATYSPSGSSSSSSSSTRQMTTEAEVASPNTAVTNHNHHQQLSTQSAVSLLLSIRGGDGIKAKSESGGSEPLSAVAATVSSSTESMECAFCGITFADQMLHLLHKGLHSESDAWRCNLCGTSCSDKYTFTTHLIKCEHG